MNSILLLSNAIAIAVLLLFHFQPDVGTEQNYQHQTMQHQAPQLAVMSSASQRPIAAQASNGQEAVVLPAHPSPESWVF